MAEPVEVRPLFGLDGVAAAHAPDERSWQPFEAVVRVHAVEGVAVVGPALAARAIARSEQGLRLVMPQAPGVGATLRLQVEAGPLAFGRVMSVAVEGGPAPTDDAASPRRWRCDVAVAASSWSGGPSPA